MNEAQERNLIRWVVGNSFPLDEMYQEYAEYCKAESAKQESKEHFARVILGESFPIVVIEGKAYVFGALRKGETRQKPELYARGQSPVEAEEFMKWMEDHAWKPAV